jgi:hypothetical protein
MRFSIKKNRKVASPLEENKNQEVVEETVEETVEPEAQKEEVVEEPT